MKSVYIPQHDAFIRCHETASDGPTVVYLPAISFSATASFFDVVTHPNVPNHRAILVDYFGSGVSDHPEDFTYSLEDHVNSIADLLDEVGCKGATLMGHSMGGTVAIKLAMERPDLVAKLIVGEGNVTGGGGALVKKVVSVNEAEFVETIFPRMQAKMFEGAKTGDPIGTRRNNVWQNISPLGLYRNAQMLSTVPDTLLDDFLALSIPRTFIYGESSRPATPQDTGPDTPWPDQLTVHGVSTETVPKAGHGLMLDNLDGFVDVLLRSAF